MIALRALGVYQVVAALGITAWWVYWFGSGLWRTKEPLADRVYENAFPAPDLLMATLLVVAAIGMFRRTSLAAVGLLAGGMAISLAATDTLHNLIVGGFAGPGVVQKLVFALVNATVGALSLAVTWTHAETLGIPAAAPPRATLVLPLAGFAVVFGMLKAATPEVEPLMRSFAAPAAVIVTGVVLAIARPPIGWPAALLAGGSALHASLLLLSVSLEQPSLVGPDDAYVGAIAALGALTFAVAGLARLVTTRAPAPAGG